MNPYPFFFALTQRAALGLALTLPVLFSLWALPGFAAEDNNKGLFLIATKNLDGTSFQETVILVTHLSQRGATGLAINRPTDIPLSHALPEKHALRAHQGHLFLGGPVNPGALFLLVQTKHPTSSMHRLVDNIYFSNDYSGISLKDITQLRAYAGYTGWGPGQLQVEMARGDWLTIKTDPGIIFEKDTGGLWQRLYRLKSANWI